MVASISGMNGFGTERTRTLPAGFLAAGWIEGNSGENDVARALARQGIEVAFNQASPATACLQQHKVGPYTLDFAWPRVKVALEADGSVHRDLDRTVRHDRIRDRWLREQGWLVLRVDTGKPATVRAQVKRVADVVRGLSRL